MKSMRKTKLSILIAHLKGMWVFKVMPDADVERIARGILKVLK